MEIRLSTKPDENAIKLNAHSGKNGSSAYEVAVENGFSGTEEEWLATLKGEKGDRGREMKSSVIIANSESGADADSCDFLYNEGDDFAGIFAAATELARSKGIARIELLEGSYKAKSTFYIDIPELIGIGSVKIVPYLGEEQEESTVKFSETNVYLENIAIGKSGNEFCASAYNCDELYIKRSEFLGGFSLFGTVVCLEDCKVSDDLRITKGAGSRLTNCDIGILRCIGTTTDCMISGCKIGEIVSMPEGNTLRNNIIGGALQQPSVTERFMNVSFGRITTDDATDTLTRQIEPDSFEIYINEGKNMTVNLYTGNSYTPAKTLTSDVFIFISGNHGDDIVDGDQYQKTLILYLKSTLGLPSLSKWIAVSGSKVYPNVKIEIVCPANTYRGVIKNKEGTLYCED